MFSIMLAAALSTSGQGAQMWFGYGCSGVGYYPCYGYGGCYCSGYVYAMPVAVPVYVYPYATSGSTSGKDFEKNFQDLKASVDKLGTSLDNLDRRVKENAAANKSQFDKLEAKDRELEQKVKSVRRKQKAGMKAIEDKQTNLEKKVDEKFHALEIKALEEKIRQTDEKIHQEKHNQLEKAIDKLQGSSGGAEKFDARLRALEKSSADKQTEDSFLQTLDRKLDKLQNNLDKEFRSIQDQLKDSQKRQDRFEDRLKKLEKSGSSNTGADEDTVLPSPKDNDTQAKTASRYRIPAGKALVVVNLPANARLILNGQPTKAQGTTRSFLTPELEAGATYAYTLRMDLVHDGKVITQHQQIRFQAGRHVVVSFDPLGTQNLQAASR